MYVPTVRVMLIETVKLKPDKRAVVNVKSGRCSKWYGTRDG